jgi:hypothetical protein
MTLPNSSQENNNYNGERDVESPPVIQTPHTDHSQDLTRQSVRIKRKHLIQYITGTPVLAPHQNRIPLLRAGIDLLINDFSYSHFTDIDIANLFSKCGFSLGSSENIKLKVIQQFKSLTKQILSYVLHGILDKMNNNSNFEDKH